MSMSVEYQGNRVLGRIQTRAIPIRSLLNQQSRAPLALVVKQKFRQ